MVNDLHHLLTKFRQEESLVSPAHGAVSPCPVIASLVLDTVPSLKDADQAYLGKLAGRVLRAAPGNEQVLTCFLADYALRTFLHKVLRDRGNTREAAWLALFPRIDRPEMAGVAAVVVPSSAARVSNGSLTPLSFLYEHLIAGLNGLSEGDCEKGWQSFLSAFKVFEQSVDRLSLLERMLDVNESTNPPRPFSLDSTAMLQEQCLTA